MKSKGANENESRRIMCLMVGMASGLKILVSAVQSRPCPPLFSNTCPSVDFLRSEFVTRFVTNAGTLQRIPAHERVEVRVHALQRLPSPRAGPAGSTFAVLTQSHS